MTNGISRRDLLKVAGASGAAAILPATAQAQDHSAHLVMQPAAGGYAAEAGNDVLFFFNDQEAQFVLAAVERLIPADPEWAGAADAGVLYYIDHQLASAYGAGGRMFLQGPWVPDAPPQYGYQLRHSPADLYRIGIEETRQHVRATNGELEFWQLQPAAMDAVLTGLEKGDIPLPSVPSAVFFETLLANTIEGFFADPAYGGNKNMVGWRMIGFPGAYAAYLDVVDQHGLAYNRRPIGMADHEARNAHIRGHG